MFGYGASLGIMACINGTSRAPAVVRQLPHELRRRTDRVPPRDLAREPDLPPRRNRRHRTQHSDRIGDFCICTALVSTTTSQGTGGHKVTNMARYKNLRERGVIKYDRERRPGRSNNRRTPGLGTQPARRRDPMFRGCRGWGRKCPCSRREIHGNRAFPLHPRRRRHRQE